MRDFAIGDSLIKAREPDAIGAPLPAGTRLRPDASLEWVTDSLVSGGSPWRLLRLTEHAVGLVAAWADGAAVTANPTEAAFARKLVDAGLFHPRYRTTTLAPGALEVVIPVRDDADGLKVTLASTTGDRAVRVTVVDDGSVDAAVVARIAAAHGATVVRLDHPRGPAAARNAGLAATSAGLVAFCDAGVTAAPRWLDALAAHFSDPAVAVVAPRVRGPVGSTARERFEAAASPLDCGAAPGLVRPGAQIAYVPSTAMVVRRAAVGSGFDESLRVGEDVDMVWRLGAQGWLVRYEPEVVVTHATRPTWRAWLAQRVRYGMSAATLEARHGDAAAPLRADPRVLATWGLVVLGRPRAALGVLAWSASSLASGLEGIAERGGNEAVARRVAARGMVLAAPGLSRSALRSYGPALVAAAVLVPPARRPVATLVAASTAVRWWRAGTPKRPVAFWAMSLVDDLAYGTGVLAGAVRTRRAGALRPRLTSATSAPRLAS